MKTARYRLFLILIFLSFINPALAQTTASPDVAQGKSQPVTKFRNPDVIFVPTPDDVIHEMFKMADLKKGELVYDLGCGDGRAVVAAAKSFGAKAVGIDIDKERVREAKENVKRNGVEKSVEIRHGDIFEADISKADVIFLYLLPSLNLKLLPQLATLKPGARIVSHSFSIQGYPPKKTIQVKSTQTQRDHTAHLWVTPLEASQEQ